MKRIGGYRLLVLSLAVLGIILVRDMGAVKTPQEATTELSAKQASMFNAIKEDNKYLVRVISSLPPQSLAGEKNPSDAEGKTYMHYAVEYDRPRIVKLLFDKGASVNAQDNDGNTPLHLAVMNGNLEIIQYLLDFGADAGKYNNEKKSSRTLAKELGDETALALMENVKSDSMMFYNDKDAYYEVSNYRRLTEKPRHIPLVMIIDAPKIEDTEKFKKFKNGHARTLTDVLDDALTARTFPILASGTLLSNILAWKKDDLKINKRSHRRFDKQKWQLYEIPNTQFVLLIPTIYSDIFSGQFNIHQFISRSDEIGNTDELEKFLDDRYGKSVIELKNDDKQLVEIFAPLLPGAETVLDIHLLGHGNAEKYVAGLQKSFIPRLLNFFNNKQKTNMLFISTCRAGGTVLDAIELGVTKNGKGEDGAPLFISTGTPNYTIIVNATTDDSVTFGQLIPVLFKNYFNGAALLKGKGKELDDFIRSINLLSIRPKSIHGATNIPQVWLAGSPGFKTYNVDENIKVIDSVASRVAGFENKPIIVRDEKIIFLYPDDNPPLELYPFVEMGEQKQMRGLDANKKPQESLRGVFSSWANMLSAHELMYQQKSKQASQQPNYIYPQVVSMLRGNSIQRIQKITVINELNGKQLLLSGVLNCIRDSFLDSSMRVSKKAFLIDSLVGNNDISLTLSAARAKAKDKNESELELALQGTQNKTIELENVIVTDFSKKNSEGYVGYVTWAMVGFTYDRRAWVYYFESAEVPSPYQWYFKEIDYDVYMALYERQTKKLGVLEDRQVKRVGLQVLELRSTYDDLFALYEGRELVPEGESVSTQLQNRTAGTVSSRSTASSSAGTAPALTPSTTSRRARARVARTG